MRPLPKYARLEIEPRRLVRASDAAPLASRPGWRILDRYLEGGRLRLRRIDEEDTGRTVFKLCKKYGPSAPGVEPIVNVYLDAAEHAALARLPGRELLKRRVHDEHADRRFALDAFEGELTGLVLCEVELERVEELATVSFPPYAGPDVTGDAFFTGASLAATSREALRARLAALLT